MASVGLPQPQLDSGMRYLDDIAQSVPSAAGVRHHYEFMSDHAQRRAKLATI